MAMAHTNLPPFDTLVNFRDVGATIDRLTRTSTLQTGLLYRSARPDEASVEDRRKLVSDYGVRHIIDLRTKTEHIEQDKKHKALVASSAAAPQTNASTAQPLQIPGIKYHLISFNGHAYSKSLLSKLSWSQYISLIGLMAVGKRTEGIAVLGKNVMNPRGLIGLGLDSLDVSRSEVKQIFAILADASNYPLLLHCTQGKDRTGIVVQLVLFLLGAPVEAINEDYMMTDAELVSEKAARLQEIRSIGLDDSFASCDKDMVRSVDEYLREQGGIELYLEACGVDQKMRESVRRILGPSQT